MTHTQTQTQIEALAKAYADSFELRPSEYNRWLNYSERAERVLEWLLKDHAVVEKNKVTTLWQHYEDDSFIAARADDSDYLDKCNFAKALLDALFGNIFNPTEK